MSRAHTAWLKALIQSIPAAAAQTFVTKAEYPAPNQKVQLTFPYWVIHPADGTDEAPRFTGPAITQRPRFTIWSVGQNADQAKWAAEQVKAKLILSGFGVIPTIAGERSKPVWYSSPLPVQVDKDVIPVVCFHVAECGFASESTS